MTQLYKNNASSTLLNSVTAGSTSIVLASGGGSKFPAITGSDFFLATIYDISGSTEINHEIVKVTARTGDTLTVTRAQESTTANAYGAGARIELRLTAGDVSQVFGAKPVTVTIDTGSTPATSSIITITDSQVSASTQKIEACVSLSTTVDNDIDAHQHAASSWKMFCEAGTGQFTLYIDAFADMYWGTFKINYTVYN